MNNLHQPEEIIAQKYGIVRPLGQGGMGTTYEAVDLEKDRTVAIKVVSLRQMTDWKILELFEREAKVLANLEHPAIPNYIDYFQADTPEDRRFYLVQELAVGESLADLVERGWRTAEAEVKQIALQVLEILQYLHSLNPPVIHRDIKPQNLIRQADGKIFLVDFGAVKDVYRNTLTRGGTFVGTLDYMPPEQLRGQAVFASDLYSLGATLLFLLLGRSPAVLPQKRMKIDFRSRVQISPDFANWLSKMLEPVVEDRFATAKDAISSLKKEHLTEDKSPSLPVKKPEKSRIVLQKSNERLVVQIPTADWGGSTLALAIFAVFWNGFVVFWTVGAALATGPFALFAIPFWVVGFSLLKKSLLAIALSDRLEIDSDRFRLQSYFLGLTVSKIEGNTANIDKVDLDIAGNLIGKKKVTSAIREGVNTHHFGESLSKRENQWLVKELSDFIFEFRTADEGR